MLLTKCDKDVPRETWMFWQIVKAEMKFGDVMLLSYYFNQQSILHQLSVIFFCAF